MKKRCLVKEKKAGGKAGQTKKGEAIWQTTP